MNPIFITETLSIPESEIRFSFARSGGKGGQNVNKVETRVELWFDVSTSPSLNDAQRLHILTALRNRIDAAGALRIVVQESRSQWRNRELALIRFADLLRLALVPKKKRVKTRISKAGKMKRLESKRRRSDIKKQRRRSAGDE